MTIGDSSFSPIQKPKTKVDYAISFKKHAEAELQIQVIIAPHVGKACEVRKDRKQVPKFSMFQQLKKVPQRDSFVRVSLVANLEEVLIRRREASCE